MRWAVVKPSSIKGADLGLFSVRGIAIGEVAVVYGGEWISEVEKKRREELGRGLGDYIVGVDGELIPDPARPGHRRRRRLYLDGREAPEGGQMVNDPLGSGKRPNVAISQLLRGRDGSEVVAYRAIRDIGKGEELVADYGAVWWRARAGWAAGKGLAEYEAARRVGGDLAASEGDSEDDQPTV